MNKLILFFFKDDDRFSYVKWATGVDKYDIIPLKDFSKIDRNKQIIESYELESKYKVRFSDKNFWAILKFIGKQIF